jgi:hypothetical protein
MKYFHLLPLIERLKIYLINIIVKYQKHNSPKNAVLLYYSVFQIYANNYRIKLLAYKKL